jgi:hypothetical protein
MQTTPTHPQHMGDHLEPHQAKNSPTNGDLIGNPPRIFNGDRCKTDKFITEFHLFHTMNDTHAVITNPMKRVALALSYIRGPKVDDWVSQQRNALSAKNFDDANQTPTHANPDEALWEDFITEFKRAFAESSWEVLNRLENLRMGGDDLEMYIATFENLVRRAGRKREDISMVNHFHEGLPIDFKLSIMEQLVFPDTIDEWQSAARKEVITQASLKFYFARREGEDTASDAAQTGVIRHSHMSEEEKARLMREGRCFKCRMIGHRAQDCQDRRTSGPSRSYH